MITAQRATPADHPVVVAITNESYAAANAMLGRPTIPTTEDYGPRIDRGEVWLVGGEDALMVVERHPDHLMIFSLAVRPGAQGKGLGQWMLRRVVEMARDADVPEIRLYTNTRMTRNIGIYRRFGFEDAGIEPNPARPGWHVQNMRLRIGPDGPGSPGPDA